MSKSTINRLTGVQTPSAHGPNVGQTVRGGAQEGSSEHDQGNEAEETGQVRVNLHESHDQQGSRANERARPPMLKAVSWESIANSSPECRPRSMVQRVLVGKRVVLLGDSEDVRANLQPRATMSSSTSVSPASSTGAMRASAHKSRKALLVLCSSSSDEVSSQQANMAGQARA